MAEFSPRTDWHRLSDKLDTQLSDDQISSFRHQIYARRTVERRRPVVIGVAALSVLIAAVIFSVTRPTSKPPVQTLTQNETQLPFAPRTSQKPIAEALTTGTRFTVEEAALRRIYHITSGQVRFETQKEDLKPLEVRIGELLIEDIGTVFTVESLPHDRARISVLEGRVRVTWPGSVEILEARESGEFPPEKAIADEPIMSTKSTPRPIGRVSHVSDWRTLARQGEYRKALERLEQEPGIVSNRVPDLLLAADVMRLSGKFKQAASYLDKVVKRHRRDPRAKLAAFTLARVYLDELGRPKEAAVMFKQAGRGKSPLAEEALAREVEAWSRAKDKVRAREAATQYLNRYPTGDRVDAVRMFGGLNVR